MLDVFKAVPVASELCWEAALPPRAREYPRDTLTLGWEDRVRARGRRRTDGGVECGTALPRGTILRGGDLLVFDAIPLVVAVVERPEPVLVVTPGTPERSALFAYHIGNSHQPLMLTPSELICPDVPGMEQVLEYHAIPHVRALRAFTPLAQTRDHQHQAR